MGDGPRGIEIFPDHFQVSTSGVETPQTTSSSSLCTKNEFEHSSSSRLWAKRRLKSAASILNLLSPRRLSWGNDTSGQEKVILSATEVKTLQSEVADLEERESHLRAQLEHIDEILRTCHLSGYLHMRTRWATLPGEPLPLDDTDVDDWLPRFVVLHGPCIFLYFLSTAWFTMVHLADQPNTTADLSPQDSTLLSDVVELGPMPCVTQEDGEVRHYFYILTRYGLRYECSGTSKVQVDNWLTALQEKCKLDSHSGTLGHQP
ncbi:pleckstrin homology domain-containing protein [Tanacetum coccineum]